MSYLYTIMYIHCIYPSAYVYKKIIYIVLLGGDEFIKHAADVAHYCVITHLDCDNSLHWHCQVVASRVNSAHIESYEFLHIYTCTMLIKACVLWGLPHINVTFVSTGEWVWVKVWDGSLRVTEAIADQVAVGRSGGSEEKSGVTLVKEH